jgi:AcrR family transcriptional regulator
MEFSATESLRDQRRRETADRISLCARTLTDERGIDGFTMDDLAEAAGVSRRTLFNYYPGKDAAVFGQHDDIPEDLIATFCDGGPTGDLIEDLKALVHARIESKDISREELALMRRIMHDNPRLAGVFKHEFEAKGEMFCKLIEAREGEDYDDIRARVVFRAIASLFEMCLDYHLDHPEHELVELFDRAIHALRSAFV